MIGDSLQSRVKELEDSKLEWQKKYYDCLDKNEAYNSEFIKIRRVVDSARRVMNVTSVKGIPERDLEQALRELDGDKITQVACAHE